MQDFSLEGAGIFPVIVVQGHNIVDGMGGGGAHNSFLCLYNIFLLFPFSWDVVKCELDNGTVCSILNNINISTLGGGGNCSVPSLCMKPCRYM